MENLELAERLIVAADFSPKEFGGVDGVQDKVLSLAEELEGLGVCVKVNSILRAIGYDLIGDLHMLGLKVFADLKLNDIPNTMKTDAEMLAEFEPDILTVMCSAGIDGMHAVQEVLGDITEVIGVTVLTSLDEERCQRIFRRSPEEGVLQFANMAQVAGLSGLILSPQELGIINEASDFERLSLTTPGIRPEWYPVVSDDQARKMTPMDAIMAGADRLVMGRPIVKASPNDNGLPQNSREAVERTLEEIRIGLERRG